jgi:hypothetical protein
VNGSSGAREQLIEFAAMDNPYEPSKEIPIDSRLPPRWFNRLAVFVVVLAFVVGGFVLWLWRAMVTAGMEWHDL